MIVVAGEALIDLAPEGDALRPLPGGSPYNVAVGLGRLGRDVAYLGRLSTDGFGRRLADRLRREHVDLDAAVTVAQPTTLAVVHLDDRGHASYGFYLEGTTAVGLTRADLAPLPASAALHVSLGAVTAVTEPAGRTLCRLLADAPAATSLDPNVRPSVIDDLRAYARTLADVVAGVDLVKVSDQDLLALHPDRDPVETATAWAGSGPALVVVTRGEAGAVALRRDGTRVAVGAEPVDVVDTVGAGDAFTAGLLGWLDERGHLDARALADLDEAALEAALRHAGRVAALTCARPGADPPYASQV